MKKPKKQSRRARPSPKDDARSKSTGGTTDRRLGFSPHPRPIGYAAGDLDNFTSGYVIRKAP